MGYPSLRPSPSGQNEVRAQTKELRDAFDGADRVEHESTPHLGREEFLQVGNGEREPLDADEVDGFEPRGTYLGSKLPRSVGIAGERPFAQGRHPAGTLDVMDQVEDHRFFLMYPFDEETVEAWRPPGDGRHEHDATWLNDPRRFAERCDPVCTPRQMIKRAEQQHDIDGCIGQIERPCVRCGRVDMNTFSRRVRPRLLDVQRYDITVMDLIPEPREPDRVPARPAADVGHRGRRWRKPSSEDLYRPFELHDAERSIQAFSLVSAVVIGENLGVVRLDRPMVAHRRGPHSPVTPVPGGKRRCGATNQAHKGARCGGCRPRTTAAARREGRDSTSERDRDATVLAEAEVAATFRATLADEAAFRSWYEAALPRVYGYLFERTGRARSIAEELTQETFVELVRSRRRFDGRSDPMTWVIAIARHKLADHFRGLAREERRAIALVRDATPVDADDPLAASEWRQEVLRALGSVAAMQRAALTLHYMDDLSVAEVASAIGKSEAATESLLSRGREALRRALRRFDDEVDDA
jgi:RNA polymerase sigma-70 factor, ECF subfamily